MSNDGDVHVNYSNLYNTPSSKKKVTSSSSDTKKKKNYKRT